MNSMDIDEGGSGVIGCNDGDTRVYDLRVVVLLIQRWSAQDMSTKQEV